MDSKIKLIINKKELGELHEKYLKEAYKKYEVSTPEQVAMIYIDRLLECDSNTPQKEKVDQIIKMANYYTYDTVAAMITEEMISDLRPANETCKNCECYNKGFCSYRLGVVEPFEKGCKGWKEKLDKEKITHIAKGYIKYGKI